MSEEEKIVEQPQESAAGDVSRQPETEAPTASAAEETAAPEPAEEQPSLEEAIKEQAREDEADRSSTFTLRRILGGDFLTNDMIRRQIGVILLVLVFTIIYIANRYSCQKSLLEIDRLNVELQDAKYKALSSSSELTERCRESNVLNMLKSSEDSTLRIPQQPPYIINVDE